MELKQVTHESLAYMWTRGMDASSAAPRKVVVLAFRLLVPSLCVQPYTFSLIPYAALHSPIFTLHWPGVVSTIGRQRSTGIVASAVVTPRRSNKPKTVA